MNTSLEGLVVRSEHGLLSGWPLDEFFTNYPSEVVSVINLFREGLAQRIANIREELHFGGRCFGYKTDKLSVMLYLDIQNEKLVMNIKTQKTPDEVLKVLPIANPNNLQYKDGWLTG